MTSVTGKFNAADARILTVELTNQLPGSIATTVIHEDHLTIGSDLTGLRQSIEQCAQALYRFRQNLFFVVTGHDDRQAFADDGQRLRTRLLDRLDNRG